MICSSLFILLEVYIAVICWNSCFTAFFTKVKAGKNDFKERMCVCVHAFMYVYMCMLMCLAEWPNVYRYYELLSSWTVICTAVRQVFKTVLLNVNMPYIFRIFLLRLWLELFFFKWLMLLSYQDWFGKVWKDRFDEHWDLLFIHVVASHLK